MWQKIVREGAGVALCAGFVLINVSALFLIAAKPAGGACGGVERWAAKTLTSPESQKIDFSAAPKITPLSTLVRLPMPKWDEHAPRSGAELEIHQVTGNLVGYKLEADNDFHVVIADDAGDSMVVEFADPDCVVGHAPALAKMTLARVQFLKYVSEPTASFKKVKKTFHCTAVGPLFFDKHVPGHIPTGSASNGIEVHPVLSWKCDPPAPDWNPDAGEN